MLCLYLCESILIFSDKRKRTLAYKNSNRTRLLVDFFNGRSRSGSRCGSSTRHTSGHTTWHTSRHATRSSTSGLVQLGDDGVADTLDFLLLVFIFVLLGGLVSVQPCNDLIALLHDCLLFVLADLVLQLLVLHGGLHVEAIRLQTVLGSNTLLLLVIFGLEFLGIGNHALNVFLGQTTLVVGDSNLFLFAGGLVHSRNVQDTVGIDVKGDLNLRYSSGCGRNTSQIELAEEMVVTGHGALTFINLNGDGRLVVGVGSEGLGLLGRNSGVPLNQGCHDTSSSLNAHAQGCNVQKQQVGNRLVLFTS